MSQARPGDSSLRIHPLEVGIIMLTGATAFLHLLLGLESRHPMSFPFPGLFYLNTAGYLILITLLYLPALHPRQRALRWLLILYTAVTIFAWVAFGERDMDGFLTKGIEIALIHLLLIEDWRATRQLRRA
jgi:hypothetical protein